jgi:Tfp pilus assembly major pilin PilA
VTLVNTAHKPGTGGPAGDSGSINATTLGLDATGDITVVAYGPDDCSKVAFTSAAIAASGDGSYGGDGTAFQFQPAAPGQYVFVAAYAGDSPNTKAIAAAACSAAPSSEKVTVRTIPTQISTSPSYFPQDSATITSSVTGNNLAANGTVTFSLYQDTAGPVTALTNCQAAGTTGRVYGPEAVLTGVAAHSATVGTNNTTYRIGDGRTYYWLVTYAPPAGDTAHTGIQSNCVENIAATLGADAGPGTAFPAP